MVTGSEPGPGPEIINLYVSWLHFKPGLFLDQNFVRLALASRILVSDTSTVSIYYIQFKLYPCFSSVRLQPIYILNDLFVHQNYRNNGVGSALINEAKSICISNNIAGLQLETSNLNRANELYKKSGFSLIEDTNFYSWTAP